MFSFLLTFVRLVKAVALLWHNPEFRNIAILILILVGLGTAFYAVVEGWHWFDALYFTVITLATVGYGDFAPQTVYGKAFTIVYVIIGLGLFVTLVRYVAEGILKDRAEHQRARQSDKKPER